MISYPQLFCLLCLCQSVRIADSQGFLDWIGSNLFGLQSVQQQAEKPADIGSLASQGLGLFNYFSSLQRNPGESDVVAKPNHNNDIDLLGIPGIKGVPDLPGLPNIGGLPGVPIVPGLAGSLPGAGACLPKGTPLINPSSPSFMQNLLRGVPGAQEIFKSLQKLPAFDITRCMGKWYWVVSTPSVHARYCATSEYGTLTNANSSSSSFGVYEKFHDGAPNGPPKIGFGYGVKLNKDIQVYSQSDPCPLQVVGVGPVSDSGQYEYLVLSNWAKFPVLGLARDLNHYGAKLQDSMDLFLKTEGYTNFLTDVMGTVVHSDWNYCKDTEKSANIAVDIVNGLLFGRKKK